MQDIEATRRNLLLAQEAERRAKRERLLPVFNELVQAGWDPMRVYTNETLIEQMHDSLTADELRTLAALPSWPTVK